MHAAAHARRAGLALPGRDGPAGEALGGDPSEVAGRLCARTGATTLQQLGVTEETLQRCADAAAERPELDHTPPRAERSELLALYEHAL